MAARLAGDRGHTGTTLATRAAIAATAAVLAAHAAFATIAAIPARGTVATATTGATDGAVTCLGRLLGEAPGSAAGTTLAAVTGCQCIATVATGTSYAAQQPARATLATVAAVPTVATVTAHPETPRTTTGTTVTAGHTVAAVARLAAVPASVTAIAAVEAIATGSLDGACVATVTGFGARTCLCRVAEAIAGQHPAVGIRRGAIGEELVGALRGLLANLGQRLGHSPHLRRAAHLDRIQEGLRHAHRTIHALLHRAPTGGVRGLRGRGR